MKWTGEELRNLVGIVLLFRLLNLNPPKSISLDAVDLKRFCDSLMFVVYNLYPRSDYSRLRIQAELATYIAIPSEGKLST